MKKFLKHYWLIIFLAFLASLIISIFLIQKRIEEEPLKREDLLLIPYPKFKEYQLTTPLAFNNLSKNLNELPQEGLVYEIENPSFPEQKAIEIAQKFNFKDNPQFRDFNNKIYYEWDDLGKNLSINLTDGEFNFTNKNPNLQTLSITLPDINQIESLVKSILEEKGLLPTGEFSLIIKDKSYLQLFDYEYGTTNNPQEAFAIQVELQYELKKIKFLENGIIILIGDKSEILKLDYQSIFKKAKTLDSYPLKNREEIIKNLNSLNSINYFKIINDYELTAEPQNINKVDLNKIELIYLKTELPQSYLQPVFFISGQAVLNDDRVAEIGIYLPAIKDDYLLK